VFGDTLSREQVRGPHWDGGFMVRDWRVHYGRFLHVGGCICERCRAAASRRARIAAAVLLIPGVGLLLVGAAARAAARGAGYAGTGLIVGGFWLLFFGFVFGVLARRRARPQELLLATARRKIWKTGRAAPPHHWTVEVFEKLAPDIQPRSHVP
jgi:hypothetical protein